MQARGEMLLINEGYGHGHLHLRQSCAQVVNNFGEPDTQRPSQTFRAYWMFLSHGFDCIVSNRSQRVLSIFFYADGCEGHSGATVRTCSGLGFGESMSKVRKAYGTAQKSGGGFLTNDGNYVRAWFSYGSGIGFHFGRDAKVEIIAVFAPLRNSSRRSRKSHKS